MRAPDNKNKLNAIEEAQLEPLQKLIEGLPKSTPPEFGCLLSKARKYLKVGPDIYRAGDFFEMPSTEYPDSMLTVIQHGMEQICQLQGYSYENPFEGLGVEGFYALMSTLHFKFKRQRLHRLDESTFLDEMHMTHVVTGGMLVLYNKVPKPNLDYLRGR